MSRSSDEEVVEIVEREQGPPINRDSYPIKYDQLAQKNIRSGDSEVERSVNQAKNEVVIKRLYYSYAVIAVLELLSGILMTALIVDNNTTKRIGVVFTGDQDVFVDTPIRNSITNITSIIRTPNGYIGAMWFDHETDVNVGLLGGIALIINGLFNGLYFLNKQSFIENTKSRLGNRFRSIQALATSVLLTVQVAVLVRIEDGLLISAIGVILALSKHLTHAAEAQTGTARVAGTKGWSSFVMAWLAIVYAWTVILYHAAWHEDKISFPDYVWAVLIMAFVIQIVVVPLLHVLYAINYMQFIGNSQLSLYIISVFMLVQTWVIFSYDYQA